MNARPLDVRPGDEPTEHRTRAPWWAWGCGAELGPGDVANYRRFLVLSMVWAATLVPAVWTLKRWGDVLGPWAYAVALVPTVLFLGVIWSYVRFLDGADELTRKIHMEAMAAGFGIGLLCLLGYPLFELAGAPPMSLSDAILPMVLTYTIAFYATQRRYR